MEEETLPAGYLVEEIPPLTGLPARRILPAFWLSCSGRFPVSGYLVTEYLLPADPVSALYLVVEDRCLLAASWKKTCFRLSIWYKKTPLPAGYLVEEDSLPAGCFLYVVDKLRNKTVGVAVGSLQQPSILYK